MSDELETMDALGVAQMIRAGDVTEAEVLDATIRRIEARNPPLNAVVATLYDQARAAIEEGLPDGPFRGVPYLFKELVVSVRGDFMNFRRAGVA